MQFSFILSCTGKLDTENYYPCDTVLNDVSRTLKELEIPFTLSDPGDSEYNYLAEESDDSWFKDLQDIQASGIVNRKTIETLCSNLGFYPSKCNTMGSLGGPLSLGIVWDIDMECESRYLFSCLRITPIPERKNTGKFINIKEHLIESRIERLEKAFINVFENI